MTFLYQDTLVAIDVARGINIGEPSLHARCLDAVRIREGESALHVGAGVGYYTAILAHLVGSSGQVNASEIEVDLAARATRNLARFPWVRVEASPVSRRACPMRTSSTSMPACRRSLACGSMRCVRTVG